MSLAEQFKAKFRPWIMKQDTKHVQKCTAPSGVEFAIFSFCLNNCNWQLVFDTHFNLIEIVEKVGKVTCEYIFSGFTVKKKNLLETAVFSCRDAQHVYRFNSNQIFTEANVHRQVLLYLPGDDTLCLEMGLATAIKAIPYYTTFFGFFPEKVSTLKNNDFVFSTGSLALRRHEERFQVTTDFEFDIANNDLSEKEIMNCFDNFA